MGKDRQPRGQKKQGGPPAADAAGPDDMGPKKGKGAPKECGEEEARTCCGCRFPLLPALLQLALGIAVTVVGFLMASISSSLLVRDTPFWAGIIVCLVAYLGLFMLCVSYQVDERTCIQFAMKGLSLCWCTAPVRGVKVVNPPQAKRARAGKKSCKKYLEC
nr:sarcospan isoform X3 [Equus asinus]